MRPRRKSSIEVKRIDGETPFSEISSKALAQRDMEVSGDGSKRYAERREAKRRASHDSRDFKGRPKYLTTATKEGHEGPLTYEASSEDEVRFEHPEEEADTRGDLLKDTKPSILDEGRDTAKAFNMSPIPSPSPSTSATASLSLHTDDDEDESGGVSTEEGADSFSHLPLIKRHPIIHGRSHSIGAGGEAAFQQAAMLSALTSLSSTRRQAHIVSEQKRRQSINEGFEDLRKVVPTCSTQGDSKAIVLRKAVNYISQLQAEVNRVKSLGGGVSIPTSGNMAYPSATSVASPVPLNRYYPSMSAPNGSYDAHHSVNHSSVPIHHPYLHHYNHPTALSGGLSTTPTMSTSSYISSASGNSTGGAPSFHTLPLPTVNFPLVSSQAAANGSHTKLPSATSLPHFSTPLVSAGAAHNGPRVLAPSGYYAASAVTAVPPQVHHHHHQSISPCLVNAPPAGPVYNRDDYASAASLSMLRQLDTSR